MKKIHPPLSSHKIHQHICLDPFDLLAVLDLCIFMSWFIQDHGIILYLPLHDHYGYRTHILAGSNGLKLKNVLMVDLFLTNRQRFASQDINWWSCVDNCDAFISCSDGTHSLQWIHWSAGDVMLNFSKYVPIKSTFSKFSFLHELFL